MLVKKLVPFKFLTAVLEIVVAGVLLSTSSIYPTVTGTSQTSFIVGCVMIIVFITFQIVMTILGINIYDRRIHFQNLVFNMTGLILLIWFGLAVWSKEYIWYIWAFFTVYPCANEMLGMVSMICHNKKVVFQKFRQQQ